MNVKLEKPTIDFIDQSQIDNAVNTLITNDIGIVSDSKVSPTIWLCKWYNSLSKDGLTYNKGDAVWINTEDAETFVAAHRQYIENIVSNNSVLAQEYKKYLDSETDKLAFLKKVATESIDGTLWEEPLYYFGDITKTTLIKVSTIDDNDLLPTDSAGWKDFFINSSESTIKETIMSAVSASCEKYLEQHIDNYHLDGLDEYWYKKYGKSGILLSDEFLLTNMTNVENELEYLHLTNKVLTGFDYVVKFHLKKYTNYCWKWFRIWNSGFIEHGGIVDKSIAALLGDSVIYDDYSSTFKILYKVNLSWTDNYTTAPSFSYNRSSDNWYEDATKLYINGTIYKNVDDSDDLIKYNNRYIVSITPILDSQSEPYEVQSTNYRTGVLYSSRDVYNMTNDSFLFVLNDNYSKYSYYASGYVKNIRWSYV